MSKPRTGAAKPRRLNESHNSCKDAAMIEPQWTLSFLFATLCLFVRLIQLIIPIGNNYARKNQGSREV